MIHAFETDGLLTLHCGANNAGLRPVFKIAADGIAVQLEAWDGGDLVAVEDIYRCSLSQYGTAWTAFKLACKDHRAGTAGTRAAAMVGASLPVKTVCAHCGLERPQGGVCPVCSAIGAEPDSEADRVVHGQNCGCKSFDDCPAR